MGTVASLEVRDAVVPDSILDEAFASLHEAERRFSPWIAESEVSRLGRGELVLDDASADLRDVLRECEGLRLRSDGAFDAGRWRPDGRIDPTGLVKGWAAERAGLILDAGGVRRWCLNVGGDVIVRGDAVDGAPWHVGIRDPGHADRVALVLLLRDEAVATSATYERGAHLMDPRTGRAVDELASMTVVGPRTTLADGYATAAWVMGADGVAWVAAIPGYEAGAIARDGSLLATDGFLARIAPALRDAGGIGEPAACAFTPTAR
jgi:thiamine biosynthesis lipoprotein